MPVAIPTSPYTLGSLQQRSKYAIVEEILSATNYYQVLSVDRQATAEEIRKAYIQKSRACHPDKLPSYPRATECFQRLVLAHETLTNPSLRLKYQMTEENSNYDISNDLDEETTQDVFERVVQQLYSEMLDGEFQTMRVILSAINEAHPYLKVTNELIDHAEDAFKRIRGLLFSTQKYYKMIQFELIRLYGLSQEIR
ncbi:DnaJ domain-containing protein, partial [Absidia repens]